MAVAGKVSATSALSLLAEAWSFRCPGLLTSVPVPRPFVQVAVHRVLHCRAGVEGGSLLETKAVWNQKPRSSVSALTSCLEAR